MNKFILMTHLDDYSLYLRAVGVTFYALFLFRVSNTRLFGQYAAYDLIIFIILGALLGEAVINQELFIPSLVSCLIISLIHKSFGFIAAKVNCSVKYIKGERLVLYRENNWHQVNLDSASLSKGDVYQELRCDHGINNLDLIEEIALECNGKVSFLLKDNLKTA